MSAHTNTGCALLCWMCVGCIRYLTHAPCRHKHTIARACSHVLNIRAMRVCGTNVHACLNVHNYTQSITHTHSRHQSLIYRSRVRCLYERTYGDDNEDDDNADNADNADDSPDERRARTRAHTHGQAHTREFLAPCALAHTQAHSHTHARTQLDSDGRSDYTT